MSRLHLLILWILAFGAGLLFIKGKKDPNITTTTTQLETGSTILPTNLVDQIDEVKIEKNGGNITLKKSDGQWLIVEQDNFPANINIVSRVFDALREAKVAQGISASSQYYNRFNLDPEAEETEKRPDSITLLTNGENNAKLYLGKSRASTGGSRKTAGRFIRLAEDQSGIYIVQENFSMVDADPTNWINKDFSPLKEGLVKITVSAPHDDLFKSWTASRKSVIDSFLIENLGEKEETKTNETGALKNLFSGASFQQLLSAEEAKERANEKGTREIKATDSSGTTFLITVTPEKKTPPQEEQSPDQAPIGEPENFITTVKVLNGPTKPEPPAADADTQAKAVYEQRIANLADLSINVNRIKEKFEGRHLLLGTATLSPVLKNRGEFIKEKKPPKQKASVATKPIEIPSSRLTPSTPSPAGSPPPSLLRPTENQTKSPPSQKNTTPTPEPQPR